MVLKDFDGIRKMPGPINAAAYGLRMRLQYSMCSDLTDLDIFQTPMVGKAHKTATYIYLHAKHRLLTYPCIRCLPIW